MNLVNQFLNDLKAALATDELVELNQAYGATEEEIARLRSA